MEITAADTGIITFNNTYSYTLTAATSSVLGGIKIGYTESSNNYAVKLDSESNQAYVTVPWTDTKVTQNILATSVEDTYPLLVSAYKTSENTTTATTVNRVAAIYVKPKDGELHAGKFYGDGSELSNLSSTAIKTALGYSTTSTDNLSFLHINGVWKTLSVGAATNGTASVLTASSFNAGTASVPTSASVSGGILTISIGTASVPSSLIIANNASVLTAVALSATTVT